MSCLDSVMEAVTHPLTKLKHRSRYLEKTKVVQRDTFANLFHDSEDFVNAFLAMAILKKRPAEVQMLLTDLYPKGPFW